MNGSAVKAMSHSGLRFVMLDVSNFANGAYVVKVLDEKGKEMQQGKLVVNK